MKTTLKKSFLQSSLKSYEIQHDEQEFLFNSTGCIKAKSLMNFYKEQILLNLSAIMNYGL